MKKLISVIMLTACVVTFSFAQKKEHLIKNKVEVEKTSTVGQKVHNVFHPKHKHYSGYKVEHKTQYKKM